MTTQILRDGFQMASGRPWRVLQVLLKRNIVLVAFLLLRQNPTEGTQGRVYFDSQSEGSWTMAGKMWW